MRIGDLVPDIDVSYFERLRALRDAGSTVVPGHDPELLQPGPSFPDAIP